MIPTKNFKTKPVHPASVGKRMLQGAGVALLLISVFLISVRDIDEDWSELWVVKPLIIVSLSGALGGLFFYNMDHLRNEGALRKTVANILSLIVYLIVLWLGIVLGLNGTLWD
ncbi:hypothetical protein [Daejeonella oryzae]|uniref:hypothetical protein n=1 Tax=Daejeonella oryzae TaxID=1122943 RepID=UPI000400874D|nr:hypothetical protein [Daejeonella oryzae]